MTDIVLFRQNDIISTRLKKQIETKKIHHQREAEFCSKISVKAMDISLIRFHEIHANIKIKLRAKDKITVQWQIQIKSGGEIQNPP